MNAGVQLGREDRLFQGMAYHIWFAIDLANDEQKRDGNGPIATPEIIRALAAAVFDTLEQRGINIEQFVAEFRL